MTDQPDAEAGSRRRWRRYRAPIAAALPLGFVVGALAGLAFWLNSPEPGTGAALGVMVLQYGGVGAGFAAVALVGASVAVATQTGGSRSGPTPFARIGLGAAACITAAVLVAAAASATAIDSWEWFGITCWIAVVIGLVGGACAAAATAFFEYRSRILP